MSSKRIERKPVEGNERLDSSQAAKNARKGRLSGTLTQCWEHWWRHSCSIP